MHVETETAERLGRLIAAALTIGLMTLASGGRAALGADSGGKGALEDGDWCNHGAEHGGHADEQRGMDDALDADSGRDLRHFPPDRVVDYLHMKLQMRFPSMSEARFTAVETLSFVPLARPAGALTLDAVGLDIQSVKLGPGGKDVEHFRDDDSLTLRFDPPLAAGKEAAVVIEYACEKPYSGMVFTPPSPEAPHYTPEVHTQGETSGARHWFVCHDFPNERLTTELIVDVPADQMVSSNGRLVSKKISGDRGVWHYLQDKPHVNYLVSLIIGQFDVVAIPDPRGRVPMHVWAPKGLGDRVMPTYGRTGEMLEVLADRLGVPYPWDRYDQLVVKNFGAGGMENTSATTMYPTAILDEIAIADRDLQGLISHELCHQWTGDLITCKSWAHIWLNEGWATYGTALWWEHSQGEDGYLDSIDGNFEVAKRDKTANELPMVSPIYKDAWETFRRAANPYPKGSSILHMLRMMLGEETFWKGVRLYMTRHAGGVVETDDFRYALEEASGLGLEWFFQQWCYRPGTPQLDVRLQYDATTRELIADVEQKQQIDARTPAFRFTLPLTARTPSGDHQFAIEVTQRTTSWRAPLDGVPSMVCVDPRLHVLKTMTVDKPEEWWLAEALGAPTLPARRAAITALTTVDIPRTIALMGGLIRDENVRWSLRQDAVGALAGYASKEARAALLEIVKEGVENPRVRRALVDSLAKLPKEEVVGLLAEVAGNDRSYATRAAAIEGLAHFEAKEHLNLIAELVEFPSQHDDVRQAALRALAKMDDARGLELGMKYGAYGFMDRARPAAIEAVGKLAHHDQDLAVPFLLDLLDDPESRAVRAAAAALAETGDERGLIPLRAMASTSRDRRQREDMAEHVEALRKKLAAAGKETPEPGRGGSGGSGGRRRRGGG